LVSPWSRRASVAHGVYDHTSILRLIEARWNLQPLTVRDASALNIAGALDFKRPNLAVPHFNVPLGPFGGPCPVPAATANSTAAATAAPDEQQAWAGLRQMADSAGFPRPSAR
jgi:phospholipase C